MRLSILLLIGLISAGMAMSDDTENEFEVKLYLMNNDGLSAKGSGGFFISEHDYGRIAIAFFGGENDYRITSSGGRQTPITYLGENDVRRGNSGALTALNDVYIKPVVMADGLIRLSGVVFKMIANKESTPPKYEYSEQKFEFVLPDGGRQSLTIPVGKNGRTAPIQISVQSEGEPIYKPRITREVDFQFEYSLFNDDLGTTEIEGCKCTLGSSISDHDGKGNCTYRKLFDLPNGDVLLYMCSFSIDKLIWNDDNTLTFHFEVSHLYAINPEDTNSSAVELKSDMTSMTIMDKKITVQPGERTEIEIPVDRESPLPFAAHEKIILINRISEYQN